MSDISLVMALKAQKEAKKANANLFNLNTITSGFLVNSDGSLLSNASYATSDFIQIFPGRQYFCSSIRTAAFYDANKNFMGGAGSYLNYSPNKVNSVITAQLGAYYVRISAALSDFQHIAFRFLLVNVPSRWAGKTMSCFGDSLTEQAKWQPMIIDKLGLLHKNHGLGGTKVADTTGTDTNAMCRDERINAIFSPSDVITFLGFTNDWANNVPLGTLGSTDTTTAYGALNVMYQKLITRFPTTRIIAMTPPFQKYPNRAGWTDTTGIKNNLNLTTSDYGKVTKDVSALYGIPVIDLYANVGWCDINIATYVTNDGALLHPNTEGAKRIAELVTGQLKSIELLY